MENRSSRIFTPEEQKENEKKRKKLTELILSEQAILVVGAGSSVDLDYPKWAELLNKLEVLAKSCGNDFQRDEEEKKNNPLDYVDKIKDHIKKSHSHLNKYNNEIHTLFSPKNEGPHFTELHKHLVELPFKGILTTNYDTVLECALQKDCPEDYAGQAPLTVNEEMPKPVSKFFLSLDSKRLPKQILHLHGYYETPSHIILSKKDYIKSYGLKPKGESGEFEEISPSWSLHRKALWSILATRLSVWLGFSMTDPYLKKMLEMVSDDLWRWDEPTHFALMSISSENADINKKDADLLKRNYGMEIVFYENTKKDHSGLKQYIELVYERYKRKKDQSERPKSLKEHETQIKYQTPGASQNVDKRNSSEWLDRINQSMEERIKVDGY